MVSTRIHSGLVNVALHPVLVQSSELIMTPEKHYVLDEKVVKSVIRIFVLEI